jgi:hypothetical protein
LFLLVGKPDELHFRVETRYRLLFQNSATRVVMVEGIALPFGLGEPLRVGFPPYRPSHSDYPADNGPAQKKAQLGDLKTILAFPLICDQIGYRNQDSDGDPENDLHAHVLLPPILGLIHTE